MAHTFRKVPKVKRKKDGTYPLTEKQKVDLAPKLVGGPIHIVATTARQNFMGDMSRELSDNLMNNLAYIEKETDKEYIGSWVLGHFIGGVIFPKEDCRLLTLEEIEQLDGTMIQEVSFPARPLKIRSPNLLRGPGKD